MCSLKINSSCVKDIQLLLFDCCTFELCMSVHLPSVCKDQCFFVCVCSAPSAMPVTSQLLRGLPRAKVLASGLLPCQQHQSHLGPIIHRPASKRPSHMWQSHQHSRCYQTTSVLHSYILSPPQVNSILKANEYSFKVCGVIHAHRKHLHCLSTSSRSPHESFHLIIFTHCGSRCQSSMERMCHR